MKSEATMNPSSHSHPGDWRWYPELHQTPTQVSIQVIEPAHGAGREAHKDREERKRDRARRAVPFGFARALHEGD